MDIKEIQKELGRDWSGYQECLVSALSNNNAYVSKVNRYLVDNAGKQLRPVLSLLAARACGSVCNTNYACAAVAEMIHTATLLHDDVADNGNVRRGVPTVKAVFGQPTSVLAGDYWLARALHILTECGTDILACYTKAVQELAEGELIQMEKSELLDTTEEDYYTIIAKKTASLFIAATRSAVLACNAPQEYIEAITDYAYELGVAFQIRDDIFDYTPALNTGKVAGADIKERKITLPLLCAMKNANGQEADAIRNRIGIIDNQIAHNNVISGSEMEVINEVNSFVQRYKGIESAQAMLEEHGRKAIRALGVLPDSTAKKRLIQLAEYVGSRNN